MTFAPSLRPSADIRLTYDVFYLLKDGSRKQVGYDLDKFGAERLAFHPDKPKGARFVCKRR